MARYKVHIGILPYVAVLRHLDPTGHSTTHRSDHHRWKAPRRTSRRDSSRIAISLRRAQGPISASEWYDHDFLAMRNVPYIRSRPNYCGVRSSCERDWIVDEAWYDGEIDNGSRFVSLIRITSLLVFYSLSVSIRLGTSFIFSVCSLLYTTTRLMSEIQKITRLWSALNTDKRPQSYELRSLCPCK
jgi:hypothetical protein